MSLLLDALDRADKSRRPAPVGELGLEPRPGEPGQGAESNPLPPAAMQALFDLQGAPRRSRAWLTWLLLLLILTLMAVAGLWLWLGVPVRTEPAQLPVLAVNRARPTGGPPVDAHAAADRPHSQATGAAGAAAQLRKAPAAETDGNSRTLQLNARAGADAGPVGAASLLQANPPKPSSETVQATRNPTTVAPADIRLFRTPARNQPEPALMAAWTALREGHAAEAREAYLRLEKTMPDNPDVQLGLASLAAEHGDQDEARARYQRVLVQDPLNQTAQAGLTLLAPPGGTGPLDSQLRNHAAAHDSEAQLALAARLSSAGQWPEAEQAWFDALQADPDNPDTLYNLAVALDHLHQSSAATQHYRAALQAGERRHARFERSAVEQRLRALAGQ